MAFMLAGSAAALLRLLSTPGSLGELLQGTAAAGTAASGGGWPLLQQGLMKLGVALDSSWGAAAVTAAPVLVLLMAVMQLGKLAVGVWHSKFDEGVVGAAVDECLKPVGWGIILLAALG
jgi:hypothetical protein